MPMLDSRKEIQNPIISISGFLKQPFGGTQELNETQIAKKMNIRRLTMYSLNSNDSSHSALNYKCCHNVSLCICS